MAQGKRKKTVSYLPFLFVMNAPCSKYLGRTVGPLIYVVLGYAKCMCCASHSVSLRETQPRKKEKKMEERMIYWDDV